MFFSLLYVTSPRTNIEMWKNDFKVRFPSYPCWKDYNHFQKSGCTARNVQTDGCFLQYARLLSTCPSILAVSCCSIREASIFILLANKNVNQCIWQC